MKSSNAATGFASAVLLVLLCGTTAALSFNDYDKTVIDTLAWTSDLSEVKIRKKIIILRSCCARDIIWARNYNNVFGNNNVARVYRTVYYYYYYYELYQPPA